MLLRPPIQRTDDGTFRLRIGRREREVLRDLPAQLETMLREEPDDPSLRRLFPPAYADDADAEQEYRGLVGDDLTDGRAEALRTLAGTADRDVLSADEVDAWLRALNDLRLVLGTRLDVDEETLGLPFGPRARHAEERALYAYLSWLQERVVAAIAED